MTGSSYGQETVIGAGTGIIYNPRNRLLHYMLGTHVRRYVLLYVALFFLEPHNPLSTSLSPVWIEEYDN